MNVEQFVMAYQVEQDRLRALLPPGFTSLRPVLRINAEIVGGAAYVELNTPVERGNVRGWLNIGCWQDVSFAREGRKVTFENSLLLISFEGTGLTGGCPAEKDNGGCFFPGNPPRLRLPETVSSPKEFCRCTFRWKLPQGAFGQSQDKTLPACPEEVRIRYPREDCTVPHAAALPCRQVLGTYTVCFERQTP